MDNDCDTTGIEPDFALVKFKKLAGGIISKFSQPYCVGEIGYNDNENIVLIDMLLSMASQEMLHILIINIAY